MEFEPIIKELSGTRECSTCAGDGTDWDSMDSRPCLNCNGSGVEPWYTYRPATSEEIKRAHGKCGSCKHYNSKTGECDNYNLPDNFKVAPTDYCNHHDPKTTDTTAQTSQETI